MIKSYILTQFDMDMNHDGNKRTKGWIDGVKKMYTNK